MLQWPFACTCLSNFMYCIFLSFALSVKHLIFLSSLFFVSCILCKIYILLWNCTIFEYCLQPFKKKKKSHDKILIFPMLLFLFSCSLFTSTSFKTKPSNLLFLLLIGETLLSPLVMCGPNGLKFNVPVELRLPHTAAPDKDNSWGVALKSTEVGDKTSPTKWHQMTLGNENLHGSDGSNSVSVLVDHFWWKWFSVCFCVSVNVNVCKRVISVKIFLLL